MKRLSLNVVRCFLPVLLVSYLVSITFFAHIYVVNGVAIVRLHPFRKEAAHKHSTVELLLAHFLSHLTTDSATVVFALSLSIPFLLWRLHGITQHTHYYSPYHEVVAFRAPPTIRFSVI